MARAACRGIALEVGFDDFFPTHEVPRGRPPAKKVQPPRSGKEKYCSICPVKAECLDYAVSNNISDGIWGGVTLHERKEIGKINRRDFDALVADLEPDLKAIVDDLESQMQSL